MEKSHLLKNEGKNINYATYTDKFNIIIMGERGVGKTELLKNLSKNKSSKFKIITQDNDYKSNSNSNTEFNNNIIERISLEFIAEEKEYLIKIKEEHSKCQEEKSKIEAEIESLKINLELSLGSLPAFIL